MAAVAGILNQPTAAQALADKAKGPAAADDGSNSTNGSSSNSATISANDFLTLLVTEMKNQDPTADTDPNEYINQLVNVNSLEQLISINQTLTADSGSTTPASSKGAAAGELGSAATAASSGVTGTVPDAIHAAAAQLAPGNLGIPAANPAANSVAQSLSGRARVQ
jgi:flagellar basal-body rod modification protein FlgD